MTGIARALVSRGAKERNQWYPRILEWHYKRERQPTLKGHSAIVNHNRIIEKTLLKTHLDSKGFKLCPVSQKQPL